ncbi:sh3 domain-containing [Holotrichia oblita]|uniref:Sh3 domain-containing n=1 Tax=Holotrichia oblita TaxID=644536 RepID=A0ACB9TFK7_HOLOL|nr:sh3 domain-containing [Holotrichia oblita]
MMEFNVKKIVRDAGAAISRVVQVNYIPNCIIVNRRKTWDFEKTELDAHFENLWERADSTKTWTEKIVRNAEAVLIPNPGNRIEDFIYEKIEKKKPTRLSNLEYLGLDMIEAGNEFGPGTSYGSTLIKVGQCEQKLGQTERDFIGSAGLSFTQPLQKFLDGEMKTIMKEKNLLATKRLDLDACKNRVRKARSLLGTPTAERDLRIAQSEFDRQAEITKLLLEGVSSSHAAHLRCLMEFVDTQARYYSQCSTIMAELQKEMSSIASQSGAAPFTPTISINDHINDTASNNLKKARVLYDYDAKDTTELSLITDENSYEFQVIFVSEIPKDDDYMWGQRGHQKGRVPKAFLEIIH